MFIRLCLYTLVILFTLTFCTCEDKNNVLEPVQVPQNLEFKAINIGCRLGAMWGTSQNIVSVGYNDVYKFEGNEIINLGFPYHLFQSGLSNQIFGLPSGKIFVSGGSNFPRREFGEIYSLLEGVWETMGVGANLPIHSVWGTSDSNLVAVGEKGGIYRFDGQTWDREINVSTSINLNMVYGHSDSNITVVGDSGLILYRDGNEWLKAAINVNVSLRSIWSDNLKNYYIVGDSGIILKGTKDTWEMLESGTDENLNQIRSSSDGTLYAVGEKGTILNYKSGQWVSASNDSEEDNFNGVWVFENNRIIAGTQNGHLIEIDNGKTTVLNMGYNDNTNSIWGRSSQDFYFVGSGNLYHKIQNDIISVDYTSDYYCFAYTIAGEISTNDKLFIGGTYGDPLSPRINGFIKHFDGISWTPELIFNYGACLDICPVFENIAYAAIENRGLIQYDGQQWLQVNDLLGLKVNSVWGVSEDDIFAVGDSGLVAHFNGADWSIEYLQPYDKLYKIRGYGNSAVAAITKQENVLIYDGVSWENIPINGTDTLRDLWLSSLDNIYVVGDNSIIMRYNGDKWNSILCKYEENLTSIWGFEFNDLIIGGESGLILQSQLSQ